MNTKMPPTDDIHVRRAIALATDYETVRNVLHPGEPMNGPLASVFKDAYLNDLPRSTTWRRRRKNSPSRNMPATFRPSQW